MKGADYLAVDEVEPLNSAEKEMLENIPVVVIKPICEWTENDFPDLPNHPTNRINQMLHFYAQFLFRLCSSTGDDSNNTISSSGSITILLLQIFVFIGDIIYVVFALKTRQLETEADIRLLWISILFWLFLLRLIFRRLTFLGESHGGCFRVFVFFENRLSMQWKKLHEKVNSLWNRTVGKCLLEAHNAHIIRKRIWKM